MTRLPCILLASILFSASISAEASIRRYAFIIGNNVGESEEVQLRYAEADASRIHGVLTRLGGFKSEDARIVVGQNADQVRQALQKTITQIQNEDGDTMLVVFYSGHADTEALHLDGTQLGIADIRQIVASSSATVKLLLLDACRSGAATRRKGGTSEPPFAVSVEESLDSEGMVILTSASAGEDAQESDAIQGSFFTHHFVSGLLGAADANADGRVVVEEAYRHTYDQTVRASSRTVAGIQHPNYQYDLRGHGKVVLTDLSRGARHGNLVLPPDIHFLVLKDHENGTVVAEVSAHTKGRKLSLPPGQYFLRGRVQGSLLETNVKVKGTHTTTADPGTMRRVEYGRLVRKGMHEIGVSLRTSVGYWMRGSVLDNGSLCQGPYAAFDIDLADITITPRVRVCFEQFQNEVVLGRTNEVTADVRVSRAWDLPYVTLDGGLVVGFSEMLQSFESEGLAPNRDAQALILGLGAGANADLPYGFFARASLEVLTYVVQIERNRQAGLETPLAISGFMGLGKSF